MVRSISFDADHLGMVGIANDNDMSAFRSSTRCQPLDACDERTGRVDDLRRLFLELLLYARRNAMCADDRGLAATYLYRFRDRCNALVSEPLHLLLVVDQGPEASNRLAGSNGLLDHFDRAFDSEAETVFVCEQNFHHF